MARRTVRIQEYADIGTGEVKPFLVIDIQEKDRDFLKLKQALTKTVVEKLKFLNGAVELLFYILDLAIESKIFERPVDIYITPEMAKQAIGLSRMTFYRHIKKLVEVGILIKMRPNIYRINPECVWIGDLRSYHRWLRENAQKKLFQEKEIQA